MPFSNVCQQCGRPFTADRDRCPQCQSVQIQQSAPKRDPRVAQAGSLGEPLWNAPPRRKWMGWIGPGIVLMVVLGAILYGLTTGVSKVREAAERNQETSRHKHFGIALHTFHAQHDGFPAATAFTTKDGSPGLSWRVALLPYIEEDALYRQFALDEPWDSPTNLPLLAKMPRLFLQPGQANDGSGTTYYQVFVGPGSAFEDITRQDRPLLAGMRPGLKLSDDFPDGTSNTILIATARKAVPWTKPDDLPFHPEAPLAPLNERFGEVVTVSMVDGSVRSVKRHAEVAIRAAVTRNGGESVELP